MPAVVAVPVTPPDGPDQPAQLPPAVVPAAVRAECAAFLDQSRHSGKRGVVQTLPRPLGRPRRVLLVGVGEGDEAGWRAAGAALARSAARESALTVWLESPSEAAVRGLAEGLMLASYRYRLAAERPEQAPRLRRVLLAVGDPDRYEAVLATAGATARMTALARDLTNTPSSRKNPAWFARQVSKAAAEHPGLRVRVRDEAELRADGFGGVLAVGAGSSSPPRLVEVAWRPRAAGSHVVLVGKGITFDTGGISLKPSGAMLLMRKDMASAAAVVGATLAAAALRLPVRVTAVVPLAENLPSGSAMRPGDVVRHYGGRTSEVRNTDAEGRLVLADALAYAAAWHRPDVLVDLATLTGANAIALGKRTGALYTEDADLAEQLSAAADAAGERVWRMPLVEDYVEALGSEVADLNNAPMPGAAGSITGALYLREFTGAARPRWAHIDMSAPAWSDRDDGELSKGATGWGVRTLLRYLLDLSG